MILQERCLIEQATAEDGDRPVLTAVWLDAEARELVASDSYIFAVVPVACTDEDTSGPIPVEALKYARDANYDDDEIDLATTDGQVIIGDGKAVFARPNFQLPHGAFTKVKAMGSSTAGVSVIIDASLLLRLAEAIGASRNQVRLTIAGPCDAVKVDSEFGDGWGLLMPCKPREQS